MKIAEPNYDYRVTEVKGKELAGKNLFIKDMTIFRCTQGEATIYINSQKHSFIKGSNFIATWYVHFKIDECSDDFSYTSITCTTQLVSEVYSELNTTIDSAIQHSVPDICNVELMSETNLTLEKLISLSKRDYSYKHKMTLNLLLCYLYETYELLKDYTSQQVTLQSNYKSQLIDKFFLLCTEYHTHEHLISFYSTQLNITDRYLHTLIKTYSGYTPKQMIDYYISCTAKKLLLSTSLTSQQISDELNFSDQSAFGQFFKRCVGMSPNDFRKKYK